MTSEGSDPRPDAPPEQPANPLAARLEQLRNRADDPLTVEIRDLADACGVSYEAARQWVNQGSTPNAKHWAALERLLEMAPGTLYGTAPLPRSNATIVSRLSSIPQATLARWVAETSENLWVLAGSSLWVIEALRDIGSVIRAQNVKNRLVGQPPMDVRICGADPDSKATRDRDENESAAPGATIKPGELPMRVRQALHQWHEQFVTDDGTLMPGCEVRMFSGPWVMVAYRFGKQLALYPYLTGVRGIDTPVVLVHEDEAPEAFAAWCAHMEAIWVDASTYTNGHGH